MHRFFGGVCGHGPLGAMHRRRGRHGGFGDGPFGMFGEAGLGGRGFRASRMVGADDLQLLILALLAARPRHGYEIIRALEEHSHGFYAPSPGVVYPALTYLDEIGLATVAAEGSRKLYSITAEGSARLAAQRGRADAMLAQLARIGERMARARQFFAWGEDAAADDATPDAGETTSLRGVRHALRRLLGEKADASPEEQRRVIDILARAIRDIRTPPQ